MKEFDVTKDYNRENFLEFLSDFLPEDYAQEEEQTYFNYINIEEGYKLGTCDSLDLDVFEFRTKSEGNRDPRVTLTREAASFMKNYGSNQNALVVFYSNESHNWRFSLITTDYELVKGKVKPLYSNPKRFSFRLGGECKAHTPQTMLFKKGQICEHTENGKVISAIEDLKNRFALEVVSKQFFDEYKVFYEDFVQYITGNRYVKVGGKYERKPVSKENTKIFNQFKKLANDDYELACKYVRDYIKKLMGRLVFLHFLQKKGWLGVDAKDSWGKGNKNFLLDLFNSSQYKNDFLEKVLEPLFFGMLNTDVAERKMLFDYKKWDTDLLKEFKQIPYLNGGLFEEEALDDIEIKFPQEMFSNPAKADKERTFNDRKDYTKEPYPFTESCGLLDFFARYNFTIDETDPADMEIGVEPEMLGKIFENLLEDNKDKGAFYTPKEIVQYMCRESLIAYLGDNEKVRSLVITHNADFNDSEKNELIKKLKAVKVCDPAVGSGAFPMGMLNELFACRIALGENEEAAEIKKQIVRDNIYGVDIEKGAVDIARLRFWLAIIVDKKEPVALPNLDYKIMQGNSLLESYEGVDLSHLTVSDTMFDDESDIEVLLDMLKDYYDKHNEKNAIRDSIKGAVLDLVEKRGINNETYEKLQEIDLHSNSDFFLWHTWFSDVFNRPYDCNGFDIVIGNPPYGAKTSDKDKALYKKYYEAAKTYPGISKGSTDTFAVFVNLGYDLLAKNGNLAYIIPMAVTSSDAMTTLHNLLENNCETIRVSSYSNRPKQIFDAACIRTSVFFFKKTLTKNKHIYTTKLQRRRYTDAIGEIIDGLEYIDSKELKLPGRYAKISVQKEKDILTKLFATGKSIASYADENGMPFYYRTSGGRYFNVISDVPTGSNKDKPYYVQKNLNSVIAATLSTTLFWFYCQVYTNGLDLKTPELNAFPLPDFSKVDEKTISAIKAKYAEYLLDIESNVIQHSTFKEYKLRKSKNLIDQLDDLICPLYGLTKEETDFIKNYEIEFRVEDEE